MIDLAREALTNPPAPADLTTKQPFTVQSTRTRPNRETQDVFLSRENPLMAEQDLLADLTEAQREAVTHLEGPLLILAAAGSGKTRVITRRVAYLLHMGVHPGNI